MADIIAETDRLVLRTIEDGDVALQDRVLNTPAVMARLGGVRNCTKSRPSMRSRALSMRNTVSVFSS